MEVCLSFGEESDETISRDTHAIIVYDNHANSFFIERGASRNLPTLNGETVRRDSDLNAQKRHLNSHLSCHKWVKSVTLNNTTPPHYKNSKATFKTRKNLLRSE